MLHRGGGGGEERDAAPPPRTRCAAVHGVWGPGHRREGAQRAPTPRTGARASAAGRKIIDTTAHRRGSRSNGEPDCRRAARANISRSEHLKPGVVLLGDTAPGLASSSTAGGGASS